MAIKTYTEQLEQVQAAIDAIENGAQSYSIQTPQGTRSATRADLNQLYKRETRLQSLVRRESRSGIRYGVKS